MVKKMNKANKQGFATGIAGREYLNPFPLYTTNFESFFAGYLKGRLFRKERNINITWREI